MLLYVGTTSGLTCLALLLIGYVIKLKCFRRHHVGHTLLNNEADDVPMAREIASPASVRGALGKPTAASLLMGPRAATDTLQSASDCSLVTTATTETNFEEVNLQQSCSNHRIAAKTLSASQEEVGGAKKRNPSFGRFMGKGCVRQQSSSPFPQQERAAARPHIELNPIIKHRRAVSPSLSFLNDLETHDEQLKNKGRKNGAMSMCNVHYQAPPRN